MKLFLSIVLAVTASAQTPSTTLPAWTKLYPSVGRVLTTKLGATREEALAAFARAGVTASNVKCSKHPSNPFVDLCAVDTQSPAWMRLTPIRGQQEVFMMTFDRDRLLSTTQMVICDAGAACGPIYSDVQMLFNQTFKKSAEQLTEQQRRAAMASMPMLNPTNAYRWRSGDAGASLTRGTLGQQQPQPVALLIGVHSATD